MERKESPDYVQTSLAGALSLGWERGRFSHDVRCTCLNLLLNYENGCAAGCSYCGLASNRRPTEDGKTFIRVKWPVYKLEDILERLQKPHPFKRVCVSMVTRPQALEDTCQIISRLTAGSKLPISALICPTVLKGKEDLRRLREAGTDRVGIAIDAATPELFARHRGAGVGGPHRWEHYWQCVEEAVEVFGLYRVGVHLIVGLGETEREMITLIERAYALGAYTHLFSFFPEAGSLLAGQAQPPLGQYRRVQLARYLINEGVIPDGIIAYNQQGQVVDFGLDVTPYLKAGTAFMTSGCPGEDGLMACNRPYGNERASEPMRNFPFIPSADQMEAIRQQLWDGVETSASVPGMEATGLANRTAAGINAAG